MTNLIGLSAVLATAGAILLYGGIQSEKPVKRKARVALDQKKEAENQRAAQFMQWVESFESDYSEA